MSGLFHLLFFCYYFQTLTLYPMNETNTPPPSLWPRVGGYSILILLQAYLFLPLKMMEEYVDFHVLKSTIPSVLSF